MSAREQVRRWFLEARTDLAVVRSLRREGHHHAACFYAQQAVEKALKSVLIAVTGQYSMTPSCKNLVERAVAYVPQLRAVVRRVEDLDSLYTAARYPNALPEPERPSRYYTGRHSARAEATARTVLDIVEAFLQSQGISTGEEAS
jgi:HEPN domain-containing protein